MDVTILFTEETHEYLINNVKAKTSVTALIERQVSKTNFSKVDPVVLANAATRGTNVHKELELYVKDGTEPSTPEAIAFKDHVIANKWTFDDHLEEFKLAINWTSRNNPNNSFVLAGTADLITKLNGVPIIADHKTTSVIHTQSVSWQLSLLDYMARCLDGAIINGVKFDYIHPIEFYVFHFDKQAKFTPVKVPKVPDIEIERLLDAEADGEEYFPLPVDIITPRQREELLTIEQQIVQLEQTKKALELQKEKLKVALIEGFQLHPEVTSIKTESFTISFIPGKEEITFDSDKFVIEHPDIAQKFLKTITVFDTESYLANNPEMLNIYPISKATKPQVRITLSKELKDQIPLLATTTSSQLNLPQPPAKPTGRAKAKKDYFG